MTEPIQKPGRSRQDYGTPPEFLAAVKARLGIRLFAFDFACNFDGSNAKGLDWYISDALAEDDWAAQLLGEDDWGWLNPEYADIAPWAARCAEVREAGGQIALLVPAGIGANWFREHVHGKALVLALNGRLTFEGCTAPYPKDCILALYSPQIAPGFDVWRWKAEAV